MPIATSRHLPCLRLAGYGLRPGRLSFQCVPDCLGKTQSPRHSGHKQPAVMRMRAHSHRHLGNPCEVGDDVGAMNHGLVRLTQILLADLQKNLPILEGLPKEMGYDA